MGGRTGCRYASIVTIDHKNPNRLAYRCIYLRERASSWPRIEEWFLIIYVYKFSLSLEFLCIKLHIKPNIVSFPIFFTFCIAEQVIALVNVIGLRRVD